MALVDVAKCCLDSLSGISEHIKDSTLYIDGGCTESFQYLGAFPLLLSLGACAVCSLENMSPLDMVADWNSKLHPRRDVTIMTSRLLSDAHRYILRCLSSHQLVRRCTVYTCISEIAHSAYPDSPLGPDAFREYETLLIQDFEELVKNRDTKARQSKGVNSPEDVTFGDEGWSRFPSSEEDGPNKEASSTGRDSYEENFSGHKDDIGSRLVVSVHHFPCILCPLSPRAFVLPSEGSMAEAFLQHGHEYSISQGLPPLSTGVPLDGEDIPPGAILTAHFIYHLAAKMDLKMEIFSLGDLSKSVGKVLTDMSSLYDVGRRKRSAGLLLVDRTLDLLTPCCHGDSLVDRIFSSLPRRERLVPAVNMRGSQSQLKQGTGNLQRAPLDVQIRLAEILCEDGKVESIPLLNRTSAFLSGWDSGGLASQMSSSVMLNFDGHNKESIGLSLEPLNGSLVSIETFRGTPFLEALLDRRTKDGTILIKKWLQESLRRENISVNIKIRPGYATKSELLSMIKALSKSQSSLIRNKGLIQLAAATIVALDEQHSARWDAFISAERMLSVSAGDTSQSLAAQIGDLLHKSVLVGSLRGKNGQTGKSNGLLSFSDTLLLTLVGYILAGENFPTSGSGVPFSWQEEHSLKEALVEAIIENPSIAELKFLDGLMEELDANRKRSRSDKSKETSAKESLTDDFDDDQWDSWGDEDVKNKDHAYGDMQLKLELHDRVDNLFKFLHKLSSSKSKRNILGEGMSTLDSSFNSDSSLNKGLLYKLLTRLLNKSDIPGLEYHSSTVGRLFKSGFGRFGLGQAKPSLSDQDVIMVFVIGGINGLEVREVQEAVSESGRPDMQLILGGTTLLTPDDMVDLLLGQSSYS
ncbi:sec1 family domain-containing protein MIP3 [Rhodamnia argentea]|uniref:Sec1 family domain-containing protein MIP3 n=1 Tax=Rhodamnia argentea TaxID=178133 RepID=A0A8B8PWK8_9MYRT|nr:sec1 family domain-containing protein MIP3 [Rhodamnia argentea]XP_048138032.1 sec1 family domain-containing protein MIP3 [Rhodamnia argentea]